MDKANIKQKIIKLIETNGWNFEKDSRMFIHDSNITIDFDDDYIIFLNENGDFLHHKLNDDSFYWFIGWMIDHHLLSFSYDRGLRQEKF